MSQGSGRRFQREVFGKLHALPSAWHRSHPTGEVSVSFARGERGFRSPLSLAVFSVAPTILELVLSVTVLRRRFASHAFGLIALGTFGLYAAWTAVLVDLRVARRRKLVRLDQGRKG